QPCEVLAYSWFDGNLSTDKGVLLRANIKGLEIIDIECYVSERTGGYSTIDVYAVDHDHPPEQGYKLNAWSCSGDGTAHAMRGMGVKVSTGETLTVGSGNLIGIVAHGDGWGKGKGRGVVQIKVKEKP